MCFFSSTTLLCYLENVQINSKILKYWGRVSADPMHSARLSATISGHLVQSASSRWSIRLGLSNTNRLMKSGSKTNTQTNYERPSQHIAIQFSAQTTPLWDKVRPRRHEIAICSKWCVCGCVFSVENPRECCGPSCRLSSCSCQRASTKVRHNLYIFRLYNIAVDV